MTWCWPNGVTDPANPPPMGAGYGPRPPILTPEGWTSAFHTGVDFRNYFVTIRSVGPGTVIFVGDRGGDAGKEVVVDHGAWIARYYHLANYAAGLGVGDVVDGGTPLGVMGNTGKAKGVHLHLRFDTQSYPSATTGAHFDPLPFLVSAMRAQSGTAGGGGVIIPLEELMSMFNDTVIAGGSKYWFTPLYGAIPITNLEAQAIDAIKAAEPDGTVDISHVIRASELIRRAANGWFFPAIDAVISDEDTLAAIAAIPPAAGGSLTDADIARIAAATQATLTDDFMFVNANIDEIEPLDEFEGTITITPKEQ